MDNMNPPGGAGKVIRAPSLKRGKNDETRISERVKLERVLGLTVSSNAALDCDPETEVVAYPAGCTVVLFNPKKNRQTHLLNTSRKTITCLAFSADGRYLVTGECGHLPSVRVWDLQEGGGVQVAEFPGHKYGINCVAFSPSHKYVVSVGSQHDMIVNVWDWRSNVKVASNKVSAKVKAVSFAENGNYFVTVGNRHVKFWYLEYSRSAKYKEPVPLMGRSAILGEQRNNYFCDVACGRGEMGDSTYTITKSGLLCEFNNRRLLDKWVELRTTSANCMTVGENFIFIGCAEGIVRCFSPSTLQFVTTLPRTHYLGVDVAQGLSISHMAMHPNNAKYPDAVALAFDQRNLKLSCVYNDHSLYIWDVRDIKRVGKSHSFLFHSACIWGVEMFPPLDSETNKISPTMPQGSFVTCSSDDTIRVWNLDPNLPPDNETMYKRNIYSNELLKVLYVDPELTYLKDLELSGAGASEKTDSSYDGRNGVRSIRISPDGKHLASGDRAGNIRIHELKTLQELCRIEAHDAEVLCLEYSRHDTGHKFLASASRDRLIHVFSVEEEYNFLQTLDDHSSSITAVRFLNTHDQLQMVSCGADKSIIFRQLQGTPGGTQYQFSRGHNIAGKATLYDMEVDSGQKHILTACQDRNIRVYNVNSGKHSKTFKGSVSEDGSLIKVVLDSSGIYAATSCTDKTLCVYDYYSGECMATMFGHSELVTGLRFTNDCRRLVSASGDGCIFVWKVPHDMVVTMHARLAQQAARAGRRVAAQIPNGLHLDNETFGPPPPEFLDPNANSVEQPDYRFSVGQLPLWAKKQIADNTSPPASLTNRQMDLPKGRWAQRLDAGGITVKSVYDSDSIIQIPLGQEKRIDSDGSKDSSIDSGTELRQYSEIRRETMIISKQDTRDNTDFVPCPGSYQELINGQPAKQVTNSKVTITRGSDISELTRNRHLTDDSSIGSYKYEDLESTEHDGDVEDYSEGEGESTEPEHSERIMYYPPAEETGSDFTVNAMDVEELRRSQRRMKKNQRPERLTDIPLISVSASVSGSQESDEDEDEVSTPSADTAERNILSMLSVSSTESLDRVGQREKYLKNTFESLSGAEQEAIKDAGGTSISSQFLVRASGGLSTPSPRNFAVISAAKQTRVDGETSKKREELQRRIEETRRKLQSVGYRSNLKCSQSISDLSHIPEKDGRSLHSVNHAHRYTATGGKQYAASLMRHQLNSSLLQPLSILQSANPIVTHRLKADHPVQTFVPLTTSGKYFAQISKIMFENALSKTPTVPSNASSSSKPSKSSMLPENKTEPVSSLNTANVAAEPKPKPSSSTPSHLSSAKDVKNYTETASLTTKTVMYSAYHTLPSTKKAIKAAAKNYSASKNAALVMEITGNICSSVISNSASVVSNTQGFSSASAVKPNENPNPNTGHNSDALDKVSSNTNNALCMSITNTNNATHKALNARTNISGNYTRDEAGKQSDMSPSKRPIFLNLRSGSGGGTGGGTGITGSSSAKYSKGRSKTSLTNQSLPESPVCEDLNSPTSLFQNLTDTESSMKPSKFIQQRRSCSYFIDLNTLTDNEQEFPKKTKSVAKSSESLPATIGRTNLASSEENLLDSCDEDDGNGDFSSDSLEEPSEFSNRTPRRCISDYQIFSHPPELVGLDLERRSASAAGRQCKRSREAFQSQESILSNTSGQMSSCNNSGDILEMCANYEQDRHSSASFFLSLRKRNTNTCQSQESILTDESEYQQDISIKYDRDRHRDSCRSTESILESDYHFSSTQQGNFSELEQTRYRDSCQSTESILTDDSDCQLFISSARNQELEYGSKLFSGSKNVSGVGGISKSQTQNRDEHKKHNEDSQGTGNAETSKENDSHRPVFRTRSLQDTRSVSATNSRPQTPSRCVLIADEALLLQSGNERPMSGSLIRKNSYPRSRPQTPTSIQMQSQLSTFQKSYSTSFASETPCIGTNETVNKQSTESSQEVPQSPQSTTGKSEQTGHSSNRPPTAPKPVGKVTHKPPPKPRQKPSPQAKQRGLWTNQIGENSNSQRPLKANHCINVTGTNDTSRQTEKTDLSSNEKKCELMDSAKRRNSATDVNTREVQTRETSGVSSTRPGPFKGLQRSHTIIGSRADVNIVARPGGVKLLCRSFENALEDNDISDDCAEEDSFPILGESGSSTPATSSSAANSPKRLWPPASRAPNHQRPLGKRLGPRHQILPSKCSGPADSDDGIQDGESGGLRRACSLSDLANTSSRKLLHAAPVQVSGKVTSKGGNVGSRTLPRHGLKPGGSSSGNSNITRSTSMGILNQSDSESDLSLAQRHNASTLSRVNGLMRPTISSQNKVTTLSNNKNTTSNQNIRRQRLTASYSSVNLSQVGNTNNNEDSSSEETSSVTGKPAVRPRSTSIDRSNTGASSLPSNSSQPQAQPRRTAGSSLHSRYGSERDLNRPAAQRVSAAGRQIGSKPVPPSRHNQLDPSPHELPVKDTDQTAAVLDVASAPLSQQLCSSIADQLTRTADSVVQLYKRLAMEGDQIDHKEMLRGLEEAANEAQRTLRHVAQTGGSGSSDALAAASKLQDIVANSGQVQGDQSNVVAMMQQYSDMLLTMVQQRMTNPSASNKQFPS